MNFRQKKLLKNACDTYPVSQLDVHNQQCQICCSVAFFLPHKCNYLFIWIINYYLFILQFGESLVWLFLFDILWLSSGLTYHSCFHNLSFCFVSSFSNHNNKPLRWINEIECDLVATVRARDCNLSYTCFKSGLNWP